MKSNLKILSALTISALTLTSCIEETFPESSSATSEQVGKSATALEASLNGIPSQMTQGYYVYGSQVNEVDISYPAFMIIQSEMLGDMYPNGSNAGYDWFGPWNEVQYLGPNTYYTYLPWFTLYKYVKAADDIISAVDLEDESLSSTIKGMAGVAYAYRAFSYYLLTVLYEPVDNIYTDCSKVLGLTVPKVTEETTGDISKNNPRMTHDEAIEFIISDLDKAEELLANYTPDSKQFPGLAAVYGIKARTYMWDEDYANAATYARKAIEASGATPMTESQWLDVNTGFNTANQAWIWYSSYAAESMGNLCNFIGWVSGEADWGYSSLTNPAIDKSLYDKIAATDFRKHAFLDPAKFDYYDYQTVRDASFINSMPSYLSLKFRCKNGDFETYSVGGAVDVPIMRVEEMYYIEAYATGASQGVGAGVALLNNFVKTYRQPDYNYTGSDLRAFELEVLTQMRVEFWGEGNALPIAKRLQPDVIQNYEGTNAPTDAFKINCKGIKPSWILMIPTTEVQSNSALEGFNNPDASGTVEGPTEIGTFAPANH
jgi:tetratricopeptide (TPR) repeat protein